MGQQSHVGWGALAAWTLAGVVATAVLLSPIYYYLLIPLAGAITFPEIYRWQLAGWAAWWVLAPLAFRYGEWLATSPGSRSRMVLLHVTGAAVVVAAHSLWFGFVSGGLSPYQTLTYFDGALRFFIRFTAPIDVALYAALVVGAGEVAARTALRDSERRAAELRVQLANAELRALKLQLRPHFLFNILNTVAMMIRNGETEQARTVITLLGDMFRAFLERQGEDWLPLRREFEFVDLYLELEQNRFANRMVVERRIDDSVLDLPVPTLILQPAVENAVKHGVGRHTGRCVIGLAARRDGGRLLIEVSNDVEAPADTRETKDGHSIGLSNTRARMRELFGERGGFGLEVREGRARASFSIPIDEVSGR